MKKMIFALVLMGVLFSADFTNAKLMQVDVNLRGVNWTLGYGNYTYDGVEYPFVDEFFEGFEADIIRFFITDDNESLYYSGMYEFNAQLLDTGLNVLSEETIYESFMILSDPPTEINETDTSIVFDYEPDASVFRLYYNGSMILEKDLASGMCNNNKVCENHEAGSSDMFETYYSCPSDCPWYAHDSVCMSEPGDNYCDLDCFFDIGWNDSDCYIDNCNDGRIGGSDEACLANCFDGIQNNNEEGIDCGGNCIIDCRTAMVKKITALKGWLEGQKKIQYIFMSLI